MPNPTFAIPDSELESLLQRYTRDITAQDRAGRFDPISGRDKELDRVTLILLQRLRKNVMLLGQAGVGKTALCIGFAQWVNQKKVPLPLQGARVIELEMSMVGAGSSSRADLEGRLIPIIKGVAERNATRTQPPIIFFVDEFHQLMIAFRASSYAGVADLLKPYMTTGDLSLIAATTREEFDDYVKLDPALERRFQQVMLETPDVPATFEILKNLKASFEKHYNLTISDQACSHIVKLADRYIPRRTNPDKSIIILDQACAYAIKNGVTGALDDDSVTTALAAEAGLNPKAL